MEAARRIPVAVLHPVLATRLGSALLVDRSEGFEVVFHAATVEEFLAWPEQRARILIIRHPWQVNGNCAIGLIHGHFPQLRLLAYGEPGSPAGMRAAARSNACGYVPNLADDTSLIAALVDLHEQGQAFHRPYLSSCVAGKLDTLAKRLKKLNNQHMAVLGLLADPHEYTDAQIAEKQHLSKATVKSYRKDIHAALGVRSLRGALLKAIWAGVIPLPDWESL